MCVLFWSEQGSFDIPYVFETLRYELPKKRVLANISLVISNPNEQEVIVGAVHRRAVQVDPTVARWYNHAYGSADWIVSLLSQFYDCSFTLGEDIKVKFNAQKTRGDIVDLTIAKKETGIERVIPTDDVDYLKTPQGCIPFTPFVFGPLDGPMNWLYSFDIEIKGPAYDILMDEETGSSIDGAAILKGRILNEDLSMFNDTPWNKYFEENICTRIVKPKRYDTIITNSIGALPTCYRLCNRVRREFVEDPELSKKVAWFTSDDPNQDFIIDLEFKSQPARKQDYNLCQNIVSK